MIWGHHREKEAWIEIFKRNLALVREDANNEISQLKKQIYAQKEIIKAHQEAEPPIVERLARENERRQRDQALVRIVRAVQALPTVTAIHAAEHFERLVAQIAHSHTGES